MMRTGQRIVLWGAAAAALGLAFAAYLRPAFMVDLANMVIALCS
jgi:hypothetical protein